MGVKTFLTHSVYDAAVDRVAYVFDHFETISVSVSSGKDSTVLYHLALREARRRGRQIKVFFLDQEAEYQASINQIERMMSVSDIIPEWYQVPIYMTNATSYSQEMLYAWGEGEPWMRDKHPLGIHRIAEKYPKRFYSFFQWKEKQEPDTAFLIGIRAEESINRFRAVTKRVGYADIRWSSPTKNPTSFRFYPIYDWGMGDVWRFIYTERVPYNAIYDKMFAANHGYYNTMRVSNLIHEKSFRCLADLPELEPETYAKLQKRLAGVHCAANHAHDELYNADTLPPEFASWRAYRDYLLSTSPLSRRERFDKRFARYPDDEYVARQQVKQLLINDWENNVPVQRKKADDWREKWRELL